MGKVLRLHSGGKTGEDWFKIQALGSGDIEKINDPSGESSKFEITSIPSPFARIDLVKTAFSKINLSGDLEGDTIYHKLVSDALDVGEMFFNSASIEATSIIAWDKETDLNRLLNSTNSKHKLLGETLSLFLTQDADVYNFDKMKRIFFLVHNHKIIGSTSPSTMFMSSANDLSDVKITFGGDCMFDGELCPLYKRDPEFIKFLHLYLQQHEHKALLKEVRDYVKSNLEALQGHNNGAFETIMASTDSQFKESFAVLNTGTENDEVEVLGSTLRKKKHNPTTVEQASDFTIKPTITPNGDQLPLVLQNGFSKNFHYVTDTWDPTIKVPYIDQKPLSQRKLPNQTVTYPYITVSDFLEPYLISLVYPINKKYFFDGNIGEGRKNGFILPIKPEFFDYFDPDYLQGQTKSGEKILEISPGNNGAVKVKLRIQVSKRDEYITFERLYFQSKSSSGIPTPNEEKNEGEVIENQISVACFPPIREKQDEIPTNHRVVLIERDKVGVFQNNKFSLEFFDGSNKEIEVFNKRARSNKSIHSVSSKFYGLETNYEYIRVKSDYGNGILILNWTDYQNQNSEFRFGVDFGTTNTHIEYSQDDGIPKPFTIGVEKDQLVSLYDPKVPKDDITFGGSGSGVLHTMILEEFMHYIINEDEDASFPFRTAISNHRELNFLKAQAYTDVNIPFTYGLVDYQKEVYDVSLNLKWSNYSTNDVDRVKVRSFLECLIYLIRNKVMLAGGDFNKIKIVWTYPSSMLPNRLDSLGKMWDEIAGKYLGQNVELLRVSESLAPFYYYKSSEGVTASDKPVMSIDIGGGTTDIAVFIKNNPAVLTSVRFAGNALFGDGYGLNANRNGFVQKYHEKIVKQVENEPAAGHLKQAREQGNSANLIADYFALGNARSLNENEVNIDFGKSLSEDAELKMPILIFFSALIYHSATLVHVMNIELPRFITFSGTASKILQCLDSTPKYDRLRKLVVDIFTSVTGETLTEFSIEGFDRPKEITSKGALLTDLDKLDIEGIKNVLIGDAEYRLNDKDDMKYPVLDDDEFQKSVMREVSKFTELFFNLNQNNYFHKYFGIEMEAISTAKMLMSSADMNRYLKDGIEEAKKEIIDGEGTLIGDSVFFYPIIGALNKIAFDVVSKNDE